MARANRELDAQFNLSQFQHYAFYNEMAGRVELIDIDGAGHAMLPEQPEKIAQAIIDFSRKLTSAK